MSDEQCSQGILIEGIYDAHLRYEYRVEIKHVTLSVSKVAHLRNLKRLVFSVFIIIRSNE